MTKTRLIVGVDYGTTFSGISYAMSNAAGTDDVHVLSNWGASGERYAFQKQVPSRIAYQPSVTWGYSVPPSATAYCWTKLLLDRHTKLSDFDDGALGNLGEGHHERIMELPPGKSVESVVTDYLALLYKHMMRQLEQKISAALLDVIPIDFWFTLPAMWSIRAQNMTRDAALRAGFGSREGDAIYLISEPEAAAVACLQELTLPGSSHRAVNVQPGNGVLVCDCGGGTVDLASYKIVAVEPKLLLHQACVSEGGKCGSTTIDRAFYKLMCNRFGSTFTGLKREKTGPGSSFMSHFESAKRDFGCSEYSKTYRLHLKMPKAKDSEYYDTEDDEVLLTTDDMKTLFDPVVKKIIGLITQQMAATLAESNLRTTTLLLVGGFGDSPYLYSKIKDWCPKDITLFSPHKSWEAVCLGAAIRGLNGPVVMQKKSRFHIGYEVLKRFRPGIDDEADALIDVWSGKKITTNNAHWTIARGETVTPGMEKQQLHSIKMFEGDTTASYTLFQSEASETPDKMNHKSIRKIGTLEMDLSGVDLTKFLSKQVLRPITGRNAKIYRIEVEIVTVLDDDMGYMYYKMLCGGKEVGQVGLKFADEGELY